MAAADRSDDALGETITLDRDVARFVEVSAASSILDLDSMPIEDELPMVRPSPENTAPPPGCEDKWIVADSGRELRIRLYYPDAGRSQLPVLMHLHGGGFVAGTVEMDDARCLNLARQTGCIAVSVDYPLAPEHPFPETIEDAFSAWIAECIEHMQQGGFATDDATDEGADIWGQKSADVAEKMLRRQEDNYMVHVNADDGSRIFQPWGAGMATYVPEVRSMTDRNYEGFAFKEPASG